MLSQGQRRDIMRFLHPGLLRQDWPELRALIDPPVRDTCARHFGFPAVS